MFQLGRRKSLWFKCSPVLHLTSNMMDVSASASSRPGLLARNPLHFTDLKFGPFVLIPAKKQVPGKAGNTQRSRILMPAKVKAQSESPVHGCGLCTPDSSWSPAVSCSREPGSCSLGHTAEGSPSLGGVLTGQSHGPGAHGGAGSTDTVSPAPQTWFVNTPRLSPDSTSSSCQRPGAQARISLLSNIANRLAEDARDS